MSFGAAAKLALTATALTSTSAFQVTPKSALALSGPSSAPQSRIAGSAARQMLTPSAEKLFKPECASSFSASSKLCMLINGEAANDIDAQAVELLAESLDKEVGEVTPEKSLIDDLGADSLDTVEIATGLEEKFDVEIPEDRMAEINTVGDIIKLIKELKTD